MGFLVNFAIVFILASLVSMKCLYAEKMNPILLEIQKDIFDLSADMLNIRRKMHQDLQDRDQFILKLNQTISRIDRTNEKDGPSMNHTFDIFLMHQDLIRALVRGFREEKKIRIESMTELLNLRQENHNQKQEMISVMEVLTAIKEEIKNQSQQLKKLQELKASKKAGLPGVQHEPEFPGKQDNVPPMGYIVVQHIQSPKVPQCPDRMKVLWEGYSLLSVEGDERAHYQDLGRAGSCIRRFSIMPFIFCEANNACKYASHDYKSYWLSTNAVIPMKPVVGSDIVPYISRCVVCDAPANIISVHSQALSVPDCPSGWSGLWFGYSFVTHTGTGPIGGSQSLSSPGSCLKNFHATHFIECTSRRGSCNFYSNKYSFWLTTIEPNDQFRTQQAQTLRFGNLQSRISRCIVCMKQT